MTTYAPSVLRHDLPGQIHVTAPLAVIPVGFTLGRSPHEPRRFPERSGTERLPWKEGSHPHEAACDGKPVALGLGALGGGRNLASPSHSRSQASGRAGGGLLLQHWSPGACRVTTRHLWARGSACQHRLSLHAVTVLRGWRPLLESAVGRP